MRQQRKTDQQQGPRIGIPVSGCDWGQSGISRYLIELLKGFARLRTNQTFHLFGSRRAMDVFFVNMEGFESTILPEKETTPVGNIFWNKFSLKKFVARQNLDLLFFPAANRRLPFGCPVPVLGTVHDLSSLHVKGKYPLLNELYIKFLVPGLIRRLTSVLAVSQATKDDLVKTVRLPAEKIQVIHHGVDLGYFSPEAAAQHAQAAKTKFGLAEPFFLYVSRIEHPGKNHVRLIRAFNVFKKKNGGKELLVLPGSDWDRAEQVHQEAEKSPYHSDIRFLGFVTNQELLGLYGSARAYFFPSLFEGFGMPILESMACGLPVFCSNTSSLPEVGGTAAGYFDPEDEADIALALEKAGQPAVQKSMKKAGLERASGAGWDSVALKTLEAITGMGESQ